MLRFIQLESQLRLKILFLWAMIVLCFVSGGLLLISRESWAQSQQPESQWLSNREYRWGDSPLDAQGIPVWTYEDPSDADWKSEESFSDDDPEAQNHAWIRFVLPDLAIDDPVIVISELPFIFELYLGQEKLYASAEMKPSFNTRFEFYRTHILPLPPDVYQRKFLFLRLYDPEPEKVVKKKYVSRMDIILGEGSVISRRYFLRTQLKREIPQVMLGCIFFLEVESV
jgi:hypothetical protein